MCKSSREKGTEKPPIFKKRKKQQEKTKGEPTVSKMPKKGNTKSNGVGRSNSSSKRKSKNIKINVLPTKKTNNEGCMDYFCGKKYFIGICVIFLIVYLVAFFSVIRRHNRVISYLHKKEDQLTEKFQSTERSRGILLMAQKICHRRSKAMSMVFHMLQPE